MKQFLLLFSLFALNGLQAQNLAPVGDQPTTFTRASAQITAPAASPHKDAGYDKSAVLDTVFSPALSLTCSDSIALFGITDQPGYVTGSNGFGDLEKLQRIKLDRVTTFTVNTVVAAVIADSTILNQVIVASIYTDLNADGSFGDFVGSSDTVTIAELLATSDGFYSRFTFSTPPEITDAESFLVGIDVSDVYNSPVAGDVGVVHTQQDCGDGTNAFEFFPNDQGGLSFNTIAGNWNGLNIEMFIGAIIDAEPPVATRTPLADYGTTARPNPATDDFQLTFERVGNQVLTASLLSTDGRVLRTQAVDTAAQSVRWSVADLPAGLYLYQVAGAKGVETGKVVVR